MMMNKLTKYFLVLLLVAGVSAGCDSFLTPSVDQNKTTKTAIKNAADLQKTVNGAINAMSASDYYGRDFPVTLEASSDNAHSVNLSNRFVTQTKLNYTVNNGYADDFWNRSYGAIADVNLALQAGLDSSPAVKDIEGQAYALRAFLHMNLLMAYGQQFISGGGGSSLGVPYIKTFSKGNSYPSRNTVSEDWNQIGADFSKAMNMLSKKQDFDKVQMNYWAARGLQSRSYLYQGKWDSVKIAAKDVINNGPFSLTPASDYVSAWASGSGPQSLFEIDFRPTDHLGIDNIAFMYRFVDPPGTYADVVVAENLYNAYDSGDVRLDLYADQSESGDGNYRMVGKYIDINGNDNTRIMRYAEVVLNYAEALAHTDKQGEALTWINKLASNRNEPAYTSGSVDNVLKERRKELAMEGFRLFDLARTGSNIPIVNGSLRTEEIPAGDHRFALPIPQNEINANPNVKQNEGYQ